MRLCKQKIQMFGSAVIFYLTLYIVLVKANKQPYLALSPAQGWAKR